MRNAEKDLEVCNKATPGPWEAEHRKGANGMYRTEVFSKQHKVIATCAWTPKYCGNGVVKTYREANAEFITLAREALPWWINRALELETENLRLQKEADRMLERERHAVHHSETYKRLVDRTREVDKVRKEVERLREALKHACDAFAYFTGGCPYDKYDSCQLPRSCEDQYSACWWKYFISKASKGAADSE